MEIIRLPVPAVVSAHQAMSPVSPHGKHFVELVVVRHRETVWNASRVIQVGSWYWWPPLGTYRITYFSICNTTVCFNLPHPPTPTKKRKKEKTKPFCLSVELLVSFAMCVSNMTREKSLLLSELGKRSKKSELGKQDYC